MRSRSYGALAVTLVAVIALLAGSAMPGQAAARVFVGVGVGVPFWYPYPFGYPYVYPYPYPYAYPYPVYSPPVVVRQPPVYVQPQAQTAPPTQYWYYCQGSQAYYPYVKECPGGWMQVVPQPGPPAQPSGVSR